jgi:hypothetical protein
MLAPADIGHAAAITGNGPRLLNSLRTRCAGQATVKRMAGHPVAPLGMTPTRLSVWV